MQKKLKKNKIKIKKIEMLNKFLIYKKMKKIIRNTTSININNSVEGETLETKCRRIIDNKEPITDSAPIIYTERKDGVMAGYAVLS